MTVSTMKLTARQFLLLGEDPPGVRLELVDGEIAVSPSPTLIHSYAEKALSSMLFTYVVANDLGILAGDVDTLFGPYDVRRPDLIFYSKKRRRLLRRTKPQEAPPDLCVEIVSPGSLRTDRKFKFKQYAAGRVPFYWIIDPNEKTAEAYRLEAKNYRLAASGSDSDVVQFAPFEALKIPLKQLWLP